MKSITFSILLIIAPLLADQGIRDPKDYQNNSPLQLHAPFV